MLNPILIVLFTSGPMKSWHTETEDTIARNVILGQIFNRFLMNAELLLSKHFFLGGGAMGAKNLDIFHSSIVLNS